MWKTVKPILGRAALGLIEWLAHTGVVLVVVMTFWLVEKTLELFAQGERLLFGRWPLQHVFDALDVAVLVGLLGLGGWALIRTLSREA